MKAIIGERPNMKPVGIGNSTSELDLDVFGSGNQDDASGLEDTGPVVLSENEEKDIEEVQEGDEHNTQKKRSAFVAGLEEDVKPKLETPAHPNVSKPTAAGPKLKKPKGLEELVDIARAEEATHQKQLDLQIQKVKEKESKTRVKAEVQKAMIEAKMAKAKQAHEAEMMKMQVELTRIRQVTPGIGVSSVSTHFGQGSTHPSSLYPTFDPNFNFGDGAEFNGASGSGGAGQEDFEKL